MLGSDPASVDVVPASEAIPTLADRTILHAGPPVALERMCGPMRGAVTGICVYEGWAQDLKSAEALVANGEIELHPNHRSGVVPIINIGIAHRDPGVGQVGAGVVKAPYPVSNRP